MIDQMTMEQIIYFDSSGRQNTDKTLEAARKRANALNIRSIVVASGTGETGVKDCKVFKGFELVKEGTQDSRALESKR